MCQAQIAVVIDQIRLNYIVEYVSDLNEFKSVMFDQQSRGPFKNSLT